MKPIMRKRGATRGRRRSLAVPFVMTAAFAPGCVVQTTPPPPASASQPGQHHASRPTHAHETSGEDPHVIANPPAPGTQPRQSQDRVVAHGPTRAKRPEQAEPKKWPAPPKDAKGKVVTRSDGSCWFVYAMPECPPGVACNPPRPKRVQCEDEADKEPEGRIVRRDDGTCWYHFAVDEDACPEKAVCNPPPPKKVDCPDED